jgi:hypothetical protein
MESVIDKRAIMSIIAAIKGCAAEEGGKTELITNGYTKDKSSGAILPRKKSAVNTISFICSRDATFTW